MGLTKIVSAAMIVGALGFGAVGPAVATASAHPAVPAPLNPGHGNGHGNNDWCDQWCDNGRGNGPDGRGNGGDGRRADWDHKGPWWGNNRHDWWDDRNGQPPWGWSAPPAYHWDGGPPHPFNYWGYNVNPVWDDGFHQWGFWLLGLWVPVFGIGVS
jgi:hypothetical protein